MVRIPTLTTLSTETVGIHEWTFDMHACLPLGIRGCTGIVKTDAGVVGGGGANLRITGEKSHVEFQRGKPGSALPSHVINSSLPQGRVKLSRWPQRGVEDLIPPPRL